jgi:esterase/lipase superfamily enzyme
MPARLLAADGRELPWPPERLAAYEPLVFLLHGFNVTRSDGIRCLFDFAGLLSRAGHTPGAYVWVSWPGDGFGGPLCYPTQEPDADDTAFYLDRLLRERIRPRQPVHFAAHSLGSRVVFRTMSLLRGSAVRVGEAVVLAAAVDSDAPSRLDRYRDGVARSGRVSVLHSDEDLVLRFAFPVGDLAAALLYGGHTSRALGFKGPTAGASGQSIPANVESERAPGAGHGDYLPSRPPNDLQRAAAVATARRLAGR